MSRMNSPAVFRIATEREVAAPIAVAFRVAADIEAYPHFVPGFRRARVTGRDGETLLVSNEVGWGAVAALFASRARLTPPGRIEVESRSASLGDIDIAWDFAEVSPDITLVRFSMAVALRSAVTQMLFEATARVAGGRVLDAFRARAEAAGRIAAAAPRKVPMQNVAAASILAALMTVGLALDAGAPARAQEVDALAGHYSEGGGNKVPRAEIKLRRELFLEPATIEQGTPGINCDHLKEKKPQAIAGEGHVVLVSTETQATALRIWFPPGAAAPPEGWSDHGKAALAKAMPGAAPSRIVDRAFSWCK